MFLLGIVCRRLWAQGGGFIVIGCFAMASDPPTGSGWRFVNQRQPDFLAGRVTPRTRPANLTDWPTWQLSCTVNPISSKQRAVT